MCPELLTDIPYNYKSDIWSLSCCMFEIAARQATFRAHDMTGLINKINRCFISHLPVVYSSSLKQIIKSMLRKSPEYRPTTAELLRRAHLQPYILRCKNPSSVFLPVKSPSSTEEKDTKSSPRKSSGGKDNEERISKLRERRVLPFDERANLQPRNPRDGNRTTHDKLEIKRVDLISCSAEMSHDTDDSRNEDTSCEIIVYNCDYQDNSDSSSPKESIQATNSSWLLSNSHPEEIGKSSPEHILQFKESDMDCGRIEDWETPDGQLLNGEPLKILVDLIFVKNSGLTLLSTTVSDKVSSPAKEDILTNRNFKIVGDAELGCGTNNVEGPAASTGVPFDMHICNLETNIKANIIGLESAPSL